MVYVRVYIFESFRQGIFAVFLYFPFLKPVYNVVVNAYFMVQDALVAFWFILPAALANMVPIFAALIPTLREWNMPLDGGRTFRGRRLFGPNKTVRGFLSGIVVAAFIFWLQQLLAGDFAVINSVIGIEYDALPFVLGPLLGLGALSGDAVKSFFKRQRGIRPGTAWPPFDQLDYIFGAVVVSLPFVVLSLWQYLWVFVIWFFMHLAASYIGWLMGLKERPI